MQPIIKKIEIFTLAIPLHRPFIISLGAIKSAENVIIKIRTSTGIVGFGECSPFAIIQGETAETAAAVGSYFAKYLIGENALDIAKNLAAMDKLMYGNRSIKSAFDMAFYDIAAQHAGLPLYAFLGDDGDKKIETDYTVSLQDKAAMAADAQEIQAKGFPVIKVKLGENGPKDVARIQAIRDAVGMQIPLRIDANQGWTLEEAIETLQALAPFHIQHCEEPIAREQFMDLPLVQSASPIPIMADESCCTAQDAKNLIRIKGCNLLNIKLGKSGGIQEALRIVKLAEQHNMPMQVGAFLESRLAMSAFAHFACCSRLIRFFDFDTCLMFSHNPVEGGIDYLPNGEIQLPNRPGIGAHISDDELAKMKKTCSFEMAV